MPYADYVLYARSDMTSFVDSLVAPMSLVNAILIAVSVAKKQETMDNFANLETIWRDYGVYKGKDDKLFEE